LGRDNKLSWTFFSIPVVSTLPCIQSAIQI
jgi:hypothetical protein